MRPQRSLQTCKLPDDKYMKFFRLTDYAISQEVVRAPTTQYGGITHEIFDDQYVLQTLRVSGPYKSSPVWLTLAYGSARKIGLFSCLLCSTPYLPRMDSSDSHNFHHRSFYPPFIDCITRLNHLHPCPRSCIALPFRAHHTYC
ncbi:uncharacterized protein AFUA_1G04250 [Aspergillus fumigatus Af293]|uniref:Uncharacterized protein n=1 Tax=Aspergillus fumigatus (strain ATCC MYA-4609 / CBS 101355 / FGSC A1100 / Af293) TaxID=330879 RepID=Q4WJZ8_ASPFU|nr:hypothetical protein AFUA_1G04250 [Aspergillus fumigatus Af293]EAL88134.1 hypothetical protein AFUA_1G04250 [Aspergillus fumigatus Af293]